MKVIRIGKGKDKFNIPSNWMDINLKTFLRMREHEAKANKEDEIEYTLEYLSIVTNIDIEILNELIPVKYNEILHELMNLTSSDVTTLEDVSLEIDGQKYHLDREFNKMSLGQFIDLDMIMKTGDVWDNAHKITASFIRKTKHTKIDKMLKRKPQIKAYSYDDLLEDSEVFLEKMPMPYLYTCVAFFFTNRDEFKRNYQGLFPTSRIPDESINDKVKSFAVEYAEKWNWYGMVREMAGGDLTRFDEITKLNLINVFNDLTYQKETEDYKKYLDGK